MAQVGWCKICRDVTVNDELCQNCKNLVAEDAVAGKSFDAGSVKERVYAAREKRREQQYSEGLQKLRDADEPRRLRAEVARSKKEIAMLRERLKIAEAQ